LFDNEPTLFSNKGKILKQFWLLKEKTEVLKPFMTYLGYLDAWIGVAKLYNQEQSTSNMSLATYIIGDKPKMKIEGFRNMMIDNNENVENNIELSNTDKDENIGKDGYKVRQNMIITGPNAAGKSTSLKAVTECILMAQTIGIIPAKNMEFTPFKMINTYLNIPDCQGKESLFQAEMSRCFEQIKSLESLSKGEFAFTIMDEIFVSTNYFEGVSGAYAISNQMGKFENSICIITTHFPLLSKIQEKNPKFTNYSFPISYKSNGDVVKTYKLTKGRSTEHLAIKLLEKKGFNKDIISDAKKMYMYLMKKERGKEPKKLKPKHIEPKKTENK
jgi:DNA mismatch repair protein MutS